MTKVEKAKVVGLLVGSMGLSQIDCQDILHRLRQLLTAAKKKYYTLVMGRLNVAKLSNFPEIDIYCLVSNEDAAVVSAK
jgi:diphthamide biosynthesis protein 2